MSAGAFDDDNGDAVIEMDLLPPRWIDVSDEVAELLKEIARKSTQLDKLHSKHVLPGFDDEDVRRNEEGDIEKLTQEITRGFHSCQRAIQRIDAMMRDAKGQGSVSPGEEAMARNIQISLAGKVQESSASFRKKQSAYLKKLRGIGGLSPSPFDRSSAPSNPYSDPSMLDSEADVSYSQSTLQQTHSHNQVRKQAQLTSNDSTIAQREREITDIARGIIELADIFKELQSMIIDQGTMLDRIDYNVERMAVDVKGAHTELKASGYQRKSAKRKIILLLVILVFGMFILLLLKPRKSSPPPDTPPTENPPPETGPRTTRLAISERGRLMSDEHRTRSVTWTKRRRRRRMREEEVMHDMTSGT